MTPSTVAHDTFVILDGGNKALLLAHLTAQPGEQAGEDLVTQILRQRRMDLPTEGGDIPAFLRVF